MGHNLTSISSTECMRTANSGWRHLILLLPWARSCVHEGEGEVASAQGRDLPTAPILTLQGMEESKDFVLWNTWGEGDGCQSPPHWGAVGKGTESPGPLSPLATAWLMSSVTLAAAAACVKARNTLIEKLKTLSCWGWTVFLSSVSLSQPLSCLLHATATFRIRLLQLN